MSQITELIKQASTLNMSSYSDYVKAYSSSSIAALVQGGVEFEKAASMVQKACEENEYLISLLRNSQVLEKLAEHVTELESKVDGLEKTASNLEKVVATKKVSESEPIEKLASIGFNKDEIEVLSTLPQELIEKMANISVSPDSMGSGVGFAREKTDPILEFLLS